MNNKTSSSGSAPTASGSGSSGGSGGSGGFTPPTARNLSKPTTNKTTKAVAGEFDRSNPTEVARETIKRLAVQRVAPTPEAYARVYAEISGQPNAAVGAASGTHPVVGALKQLVVDLRDSNHGKRAAQPLASALEQNNWEQVRTALASLGNVGDGTVQSWPELLRDLLRQWEARQEGLTQARKREGLEHVLTTFGNDPYKLYPRLRSLTRSWGDNAAQEGATLVSDSQNESGATEQRNVAMPLVETNNALLLPERRSAQEIANSEPIRIHSAEDEIAALRELLAHTMTYSVTQRLGYSEEMESEAQALAQMCRTMRTVADVNKASSQLKQFWVRLELRGETLDQMVRGLLTLLQLLVQNMSDLMEDDRWVNGQVSRMQEMLNQPLSVETLQRAGESFREFIHRQGTLKTSLDQAKQAIRNMVQVFIDRLAVMSESTGTYSERVEGYAVKLKNINDLPQLSQLVESLMQDTRTIQSEMIRSHEELMETREQVQRYEVEIHKLQESLEAISEMIKEDALTKTLNRRGLEQVFDMELARCARKNKPLSLALLDIDNFKQLNDLLGHQAGDAALVHLSEILRQVVRPTDAVARYGGEEFVIVLPETDVSEAEKIMIRVQRELTKRFFLHNHEKVLITFSAGVTGWQQNESRETMIERADQAMYQAKKTGKNRVVRIDPA